MSRRTTAGLDPGLEVVGNARLALLAVVVLGRRPDVDVVDPPLVLLLAQHDPVADTVLVPAQLRAVVAELIDPVVDPLADAGDEARDLAHQAVAPALGEHVEHALDIARGDRVGEQPDRIARLPGARSADQLALEPPGLALALELHELAVGEADHRALADVGVALEPVLEHLRLPRALLVALLPRQRELV